MHRSVLRTGLVIGGLLVAGGARADFDDKKANETMAKAGCAACHRVDGKSVGPSYKDVAKKYKGQKDAVANLSGKVRKGGAGVWGPIPMSPNPPDKISDGDLKELTEWILKR